MRNSGLSGKFLLGFCLVPERRSRNPRPPRKVFPGTYSTSIFPRRNFPRSCPETLFGPIWPYLFSTISDFFETVFREICGLPKSTSGPCLGPHLTLDKGLFATFCDFCNFSGIFRPGGPNRGFSAPQYLIILARFWTEKAETKPRSGGAGGCSTGT